MNARNLLSLLLLALALAAGAGWWLQRASSAQVRGELALLRDEQRELAKLRAENQRLTTALPPATKLAALRADHAAVVRLRGEIEKLREHLQMQERALAEGR